MRRLADPHTRPATVLEAALAMVVASLLWSAIANGGAYSGPALADRGAEASAGRVTGAGHLRPSREPPMR